MAPKADSARQRGKGVKKDSSATQSQPGKLHRADPRATNNKHAINKSYLITIPHPVVRRLRKKTTPLASPSSFTREQIEKVFLAAAQRPLLWR